MSTSLSLNKQCSRCPRVEQTDVTIDEAVKLAQQALKAPKALVVSVNGEELASFDALCSVCQTIVTKYIDGATKRPKNQSALRDTEIKVEAD